MGPYVSVSDGSCSRPVRFAVICRGQRTLFAVGGSAMAWPWAAPALHCRRHCRLRTRYFSPLSPPGTSLHRFPRGFPPSRHSARLLCGRPCQSQTTSRHPANAFSPSFPFRPSLPLPTAAKMPVCISYLDHINSDWASIACDPSPCPSRVYVRYVRPPSCPSSRTLRIPLVLRPLAPRPDERGPLLMSREPLPQHHSLPVTCAALTRASSSEHNRPVRARYTPFSKAHRTVQYL